MLSMHKSNVDVDLDTFDIGLLKFLQALLDTRGITRAGELLAMTQPAASRAMTRLRQHFGDPLLVRTSRGYVLTPVAELLRPSVHACLDSMHALFDVAAFDIADTARTFRIASTDYGLSVVLQPQLASLRQIAPFVAWQTDPWSDDTMAKLERGELDCALYSDEPLSPDFHYRTLFTDGYALVCQPNHPLASLGKMDSKSLLEDAAHYPQWAPRYLSSRRYMTDNVYERLGLKSSNIVLATPSFHTALECILQSDWLAVVPERLARIWAKTFVIAVLPIQEKNLRFEYRLIWHERAHRDKGLQWFKEQLVRNTVS
ncbi:LysR family transcriptional regulator [Limnohabitans planktonicus II-D5]|uniref:LysR family transcriptional regulator n=2 Tax=Limnohabitans planktonicus TaxID=540060 RepID=A0A2T7UH78_9BURK|nr:LysR family transcriptional regulator [Limnohabitans planktonicus II-D5]|eukprot:gene22030-26988_t